MMSTVDTRPVEAPDAAHPFRVWMRPTGLSWKIAVEAGHEAKWLTKRLADQGFESVVISRTPTTFTAHFGV